MPRAPAQDTIPASIPMLPLPPCPTDGRFEYKLDFSILKFQRKDKLQRKLVIEDTIKNIAAHKILTTSLNWELCFDGIVGFISCFPSTPDLSNIEGSAKIAFCTIRK
ncbi:MAG TPA: hypothetical protein PKD32_09680 [Saprospiraceae bacterium]|nr:hypothetical protein [Saprospiraceae bacterium]